MPRRFAVLLLLAASACATAPVPQPAAVAPGSLVDRVAEPPASASPHEWESWPPPAASRAAKPSRSGRTITIEARDGGWKILDLFEMVSKETGRSFLFDTQNATFKQAKVEFIGTQTIAEEDLFPWLQAVLSYRKLVLVPVGPSSPDGKQQWFVMDQADPGLKSRPVFIQESEIEDYANRDGLYVVTTIRLRDTVDAQRARNALSPLLTATAGIGRLSDQGHFLVIGDFAPVVASMKRLLDRINAETTPAMVPPAPPAAPK